MTLEILVAAFFLFSLVWRLIELLLVGDVNVRTNRLAKIILVLIGILWLVVFGNIPPLRLS